MYQFLSQGVCTIWTPTKKRTGHVSVQNGSCVADLAARHSYTRLRALCATDLWYVCVHHQNGYFRVCFQSPPKIRKSLKGRKSSTRRNRIVLWKRMTWWNTRNLFMTVRLLQMVLQGLRPSCNLDIWNEKQNCPQHVWRTALCDRNEPGWSGWLFFYLFPIASISYWEPSTPSFPSPPSIGLWKRDFKKRKFICLSWPFSWFFYLHAFWGFFLIFTTEGLKCWMCFFNVFILSLVFKHQVGYVLPCPSACCFSCKVI